MIVSPVYSKIKETENLVTDTVQFAVVIASNMTSFVAKNVAIVKECVVCFLIMREMRESVTVKQ